MPAGTAIPFGRYFASRHRVIINDESLAASSAQLGDHANARQQYRAVTDEVPSYTIANSSRIGKLFT